MPHLPARAPVVVVALAAGGVLAGGLHYASTSAAAGADRPSPERGPRVTATASTVAGELYPGGAVTGSLLVSTDSREPVEMTAASFEPATTITPGCATAGVAFAPTVEVSDVAPLLVPAGGGAGGPVTPLGWTAFLSLDADDACQGATFRSALVLDGQRAGTVTAVAGTLPRPGAPVGGLTTPTRAAVRWPAAPAATAATGLGTATVAHVVERAPAGTSAWSSACGTSSAAPARTPACTDTGLTPGTAYVYRVTSVLGTWRAVGPASSAIRTRPAPQG